jgi:DNA-binding transcriptional LysR family regulator
MLAAMTAKMPMICCAESDAGRIQLAFCDAEFLEGPLRWSKRVPMLWAAAETFDANVDPLLLAMFSAPCRWRGLVQSALSAVGKSSRIVFESGSLTAVQAAVRAGLGVTTLLPTAMAHSIVSAPISQLLPPLSEIDIGLSRRPESDGDVLTSAVEAMLKHLI